MTAAVFDYTTWAARYPELAATVNTQLATIYWTEATLYCDNTPCSPVQDITQRTMLLNMVTAHIAALNGPASSPLVGRISNATEGSVSVQTQLDLPPGSAQWFAQTKYGMAFWQATAQYRMARYVPGPAYVANPYPVVWGYPNG